MAIVKVNTSDTEWIERRGQGVPVIYGADVKGVMHFQAVAEVSHVERVKFAGASMIRFDLGADGPRDHARWARYPESYLVAE